MKPDPIIHTNESAEVDADTWASIPPVVEKEYTHWQGTDRGRRTWTSLEDTEADND